MLVKFATLCDSCSSHVVSARSSFLSVCKLCYAQRHGRAWPGGYTLLNLMKDGGILCGDCVHEEEVHLGDEANPQWQLDSQFIHWEGLPLFCDNCGVECPSEYGDPDEENEDDNEE